MNIAVNPIPYNGLVPRIGTPYTVVTQFRNKRVRSCIKCETMAQVRDAIKRQRANPNVTYIFYNIPEMDHIEAYDVRDRNRYV